MNDHPHPLIEHAVDGFDDFSWTESRAVVSRAFPGLPVKVESVLITWFKRMPRECTPPHPDLMSGTRNYGAVTKREYVKWLRDLYDGKSSLIRAANKKPDLPLPQMDDPRSIFDRGNREKFGVRCENCRYWDTYEVLGPADSGEQWGSCQRRSPQLAWNPGSSAPQGEQIGSHYTTPARDWCGDFERDTTPKEGQQ